MNFFRVATLAVLTLGTTLFPLAVQGQPASVASAASAPARPVLSVTVTQPRTDTLVQRVPANGSLAAWQEAVIGAEAQGLRLIEVRVNIGDRVRAGDVLARLQDDTVRAELAQAEAALAESTAAAEEAGAQAERARTLQQQGFFSAAQLTQALSAEAGARARVQSARALLRLQTLRLAQTVVRAPDAGLVSARQATVGSVVSPGTELFRLIRQGRLEWRAEVMAAELGRIRVGAPVRLTAASGQILQGRVRVIAPSLDPQTRNALVYVDLIGPPGSARAGMFARGEIEWGQSQALTVPQTAVVVRDGFSHVHVLQSDQRVDMVKVQTGRMEGDRIEIAQGLAAGARVVVSGGAFLNHGDRVRVVDAPTSGAAPAATGPSAPASTVR
jgi:HlyD family secretion protein